jgi:hypothetical protein
MSKGSYRGRALIWLAAPFIVSSVTSAVAAPAKRHKPKRATEPPPSSVPAAPEEDATSKSAKDAPAGKADETPVKSVTPAQVNLDDESAVKADDKAQIAPASKAAGKSQSEPASERRATATPDHEGALEPDTRLCDQVLAKREAARIAAGRVEVAVSASVDVGNRRFSYSDPIGPLLGEYRLPLAPMMSFGIEAYPWATTGVPVLRDLGFRGRISRAFAVDSTTSDGVAIETSWTRFDGVLRGRLLFPGSHSFELGIYAGVDASYFDMSTKTKVATLLPSARTVSLRFGFDTRLLVAWRLSLMLGAAYLVPTSSGEIYHRFRSPSVGGIDTDFGFALAIIPGLEAQLTGRYTRYFASFEPVLGDSTVAGGAVDEQMQFGLGVRYAH